MTLFYNPRTRKLHTWVFIFFLFIPIILLIIVIVNGNNYAKQKTLRQETQKKDIFDKF